MNLAGATPLTIRGVHLPDASGLFDVALANGRISEITPVADGASNSGGKGDVLADGGLLLPGLLDAHCHIDQSLMSADWRPIPPSGAFIEKIRAAEDVLLGMTNPALVDRVEALARLMVVNGTLTARSHASITDRIGLLGVEALLEVQRRVADLMTLQIVVFPQFGTRDPATVSLMDEAMRLGCDVVGGMDPGTIDRDIEASLRTTFELAERHGARIDIHVHDPGHLGLYELRRLCAWTDRTGMAGRVVASHGLCLGELPEDDVAETMRRLAASEVAVVSTANPNAAMPRLRDVREHGLVLGLGSNSAHTSAPFGTSDMLKKANLLAQRHTFVSDVDLLDTLDRITRVNAGILGVPSHPIAVGSPADFLLVAARNGAEAIASPPRRRTVFVAGEIVAQTA